MTTEFINCQFSANQIILTLSVYPFIAPPTLTPTEDDADGNSKAHIVLSSDWHVDGVLLVTNMVYSIRAMATSTPHILPESPEAILSPVRVEVKKADEFDGGMLTW